MLCFEDETWWSRYAQPAVHSWSDAEALRLHERVESKVDTEVKAISCYGLLRTDTHQVMLRFVEGRPVSSVTTEFLAWACDRLAAEGKSAMLLVWDNATWHKSQAVRQWVQAHNRRVKREGGVRILVCLLPVKSPWLNPIEARWAHGKRAVVEAERMLTVQELTTRVCEYFGCEQTAHLKQHVS